SFLVSLAVSSAESTSNLLSLVPLPTNNALFPYTTLFRSVPDFKSLEGEANVSSAVGVAAVQTAFNLKAKCIVTPTMSGQTARLRSEEHTSELQSRFDLVCRLLLEKKNQKRAIELTKRS